MKHANKLTWIVAFLVSTTASAAYAQGPSKSSQLAARERRFVTFNRTLQKMEISDIILEHTQSCGFTLELYLMENLLNSDLANMIKDSVLGDAAKAVFKGSSLVSSGVTNFAYSRNPPKFQDSDCNETYEEIKTLQQLMDRQDRLAEKGKLHEPGRTRALHAEANSFYSDKKLIELDSVRMEEHQASIKNGALAKALGQ